MRHSTSARDANYRFRGCGLWTYPQSTRDTRTDDEAAIRDADRSLVQGV